MEPLKLRPKAQRKMQFYLETRDHGALFSIIAKKQRGQVLTEANDAARRLTAKRRDARFSGCPGDEAAGKWCYLTRLTREWPLA